MVVTENQVLELVPRTAKPANRPEHRRLATRVTSVNQRQPIVALDQEGVRQPHRDHVHRFDHGLQSHRRTTNQSLH